MRPTNADLNKWFTRLRKRIGGPPGFKRANARTCINRGDVIDKGIAITTLDKAHTRESLCVTFGCFVGFPFEMSEHYRNFGFYFNYRGMRIERFADIDGSFGNRHGLGFDLTAENLDEYEEGCAAQFTNSMKPWLDQYVTRDDVLQTFSNEVGDTLPFRFDPERVPIFRAEVADLLATRPGRWEDRRVDWLHRKGIVSADEAAAIKLASIQAIDDCVERIRSIGNSIANYALKSVGMDR